MFNWFVRGLTISTILASAAIGRAQIAPAQRLPYAAVHDPQFIQPAEATFLHDEDRIIGVTVGATAKAFPAAILSQHGLVEDETPKGPIAVTW